MLFFYELLYLASDREGQYQIVDPLPRFTFQDRIAASMARARRAGRRCHRYSMKRTLQPVSKDVVILAALLGNDSLHRRAQSRLITGCTGSHDRQEKITTSQLPGALNI